MFTWRITKYNPRYRDVQGGYLKDAWTSYSDIGKTFDGVVLTYTEYKNIEDAYVEAVLAFLQCMNMPKLAVHALEKHETEIMYDQQSSRAMSDIFATIQNGQQLSYEQIAAVTRLALREMLWCKLESENMYIHFGYDYYLYMGSKGPCESMVKQAEHHGLFVERYASPYSQEI